MKMVKVTLVKVDRMGHALCVKLTVQYIFF